MCWSRRRRIRFGYAISHERLDLYWAAFVPCDRVDLTEPIVSVTCFPFLCGNDV